MGYTSGMERIGIRELKQHTSKWVKKAHRGQPIEVTSRGELMARLIPAVDPADPVAELIAAGIIREAEEPWDLTGITPSPPLPGRPSISEALQEQREERL